MNPTDTVRVLRVVGAMCPAQRIDEHTAEAWHEVLGDLRVEDCVAAVRELGGREAFISPADIRGEVRRLRRTRLDRTPLPEPPVGLGDDPGAYLAWSRATTATIADGTFEQQPAPALQARPGVMRALGRTFTTPQEARQGVTSGRSVPATSTYPRGERSDPQRAAQGEGGAA